jgi:predicted enzyme related to lactoylglutathione lyase
MALGRFTIRHASAVPSSNCIRRATRRPRGLRLGFLVSDLADALPLIEGAGGKVLRAELSQPASALVEDPDGHTLELLQPSS